MGSVRNVSVSKDTVQSHVVWLEMSYRETDSGHGQCRVCLSML